MQANRAWRKFDDAHDTPLRAQTKQGISPEMPAYPALGAPPLIR